MHSLLLVAICYLAVNFLVALVLHLHGLRQAHLRLRFLDVLMYFLLFSALAIPLLLTISAEAFFGGSKGMREGAYGPVAQHH